MTSCDPLKPDLHDPLADQPVDEIPREGALAPDAFVRRYARRRRPVVLAATTVVGWSLERLARELSDVEVSAIHTIRGRLDGTARRGTAFARVPFGDVLSELSANEHVDWHVSTPIDDLPEAFARDVRVPPYCASAAFVRSRVWLGPAGTVTPLHWDLPANFIRPVFGRRRVLLYPPSDGLFIRPNSPSSRMPNFARFDPERSQPSFVSRFTRPVRAVIGPGDLLFIPPGWWHHIRSLETSLVVNYWWGGQVLAAFWRAAQWYKSMRGLYRNEWVSRRPSR